MSKNKVVLGKHSVNFVLTKSEELRNGLVIVEAEGNALGSLLEIVEGETVVPSYNCGSIDIVIKKGQCVCRVEEVIEVDQEDLNRCFEEVNLVERVVCQPIRMEEVNFGESLSMSERKEILELINEYRDSFVAVKYAVNVAVKYNSLKKGFN